MQAGARDMGTAVLSGVGVGEDICYVVGSGKDVASFLSEICDLCLVCVTS